ncbi:MAG: fumarylacetoacetate hydrolase family protein [Armatimonadetes bacterium]|nr:fumarylacetoacetate hydrolase family protein [Armatimonadota bacterium]MDE2206929.1 fumarylacetoacetate hydrolase family protein [Armatimonadota bacterium]
MTLCRIRAVDQPANAPAHWAWLAREAALLLPDEAIHSMCRGETEGGLAGIRMLPAESTLHRDQYLLQPPTAWDQQIWAAGVTWESSRHARMAESPESADCYSRVYLADRPEIFYKSRASAAVGPGGAVRVRADSRWSVPEPEVAVLADANGVILGVGLANDMSARDIEGENPLYLPQAKVYRGACALGPAWVAYNPETFTSLTIHVSVMRRRECVWRDKTSVGQMKRRPEELVDWLFRENAWPDGVVLLTGTGLTPPKEFALEPGDDITIWARGLGVLRNRVEG